MSRTCCLKNPVARLVWTMPGWTATAISRGPHSGCLRGRVQHSGYSSRRLQQQAVAAITATTTTECIAWQMRARRWGLAAIPPQRCAPAFCISAALSCLHVPPCRCPAHLPVDPALHLLCCHDLCQLGPRVAHKGAVATQRLGGSGWRRLGLVGTVAGPAVRLGSDCEDGRDARWARWAR